MKTATSNTTTSITSTTSTRWQLWRFMTLHELALLLLFIGIMLIFSVTTEAFWDSWNLADRSRHLVEIGLVAIPMTMVICTGGIDLSVGSTMVLSGLLMGMFWRDGGVNIWLAAVISILVGSGCGLFNGMLAAFCGIPPLVVTLATRALYRGLALGLSEANPVRRFPAEYLAISEYAWGMVPVTFVLMLICYALGHIFLSKSWAGRYLLAMGENETAARFAAVPVNRLKLLVYFLTGLMCGVAAVVYVARFATANPEHAQTFELDVIAAVVVGGTSITGGRGSVLGTGLGLLVIGALRYGFDMNGIPQQTQTIVMGVLLVLVAVSNEWFNRKR